MRMQVGGTLKKLGMVFCLAVLLAGSGALGGTTQGSAQVEGMYFVYLPTVSKLFPLFSLQNANFEAGNTGWTETSFKGWKQIVNSDDYKAATGSNLPTRSGKWIAWLGGDANENGSISQMVTVLAGAPYLTFYAVVDSMDDCEAGKEELRIIVNSEIKYTHLLCDQNSTTLYNPMSYNLSAYADTAVTIAISAITDDDAEISNVFIDDVSFTGAAVTSLAADSLPDQHGGAGELLQGLLKEIELGR